MDIFCYVLLSMWYRHDRKFGAPKFFDRELVFPGCCFPRAYVVKYVHCKKPCNSSTDMLDYTLLFWYKKMCSHLGKFIIYGMGVWCFSARRLYRLWYWRLPSKNLKFRPTLLSFQKNCPALAVPPCIDNVLTVSIIYISFAYS